MGIRFPCVKKMFMSESFHCRTYVIVPLFYIYTVYFLNCRTWVRVWCALFYPKAWLVFKGAGDLMMMVSIVLKQPILVVFCPHLSQGLPPTNNLRDIDVISTESGSGHALKTQISLVFFLCLISQTWFSSIKLSIITKNKTLANKTTVRCSDSDDVCFSYFFHNIFSQFLNELSSVLLQIAHLIMILLVNT